MIYALDASAILAVLFEEPGAERVRAILGDAIVSTVNLSEVAAKLSEKGADEETIRTTTGLFAEISHSFDAGQAIDAGILRKATRSLGLSLGESSCLALAIAKKAMVLTADSAWADLDLGVEVELIR